MYHPTPSAAHTGPLLLLGDYRLLIAWGLRCIEWELRIYSGKP